MHGYVEYKVEMQGACSSVRVTMPGKVRLELPDGTKYSSMYPECIVEGLMSTQKILNPIGAITLTDLTNDIEMEIKFDAEEDKRSSGIMSFFSSSPQMTETGGLEFRRDLISILIYQLERSQQESNEEGNAKPTRG